MSGQAPGPGPNAVRVACPRCGGFAEVVLSGDVALPTLGAVEVGHCLRRRCAAWFSLPGR